MSNELQMTARCYQWAHNTYPAVRGLLFRIKNELDNHGRKLPQDRIKQIMENKATGIVEGVSDFAFAWYKMHFIELKIIGGRQSDAQKKFQAAVMRMGHLYHLVWSEDEFKDLMKNIINGTEDKTTR